MPAKNCVNTPNTIVKRTTTFLSTPKYSASIIAIKNNDQPTKCFQLYWKNAFSFLSRGLGLIGCFLLLFLLFLVSFAIFQSKSDEQNLYQKINH